MPWTAQDMPDQTGRAALVTGANSGLGYETALALARQGAQVIMACRNLDKGQAAHDRILAEVPAARLDLRHLDLGRLDSVREFAAGVTGDYAQLHMLVNNAGVMAPPRGETADGFELQFGINHLGHFALTGLLLDPLLHAPGSRVVTVSSNAFLAGRINFDDLQSEKRYSRYLAYCQSKLANVLFAFELQRRYEAAGVEALSMAAHPGLAETNLQSTTAQTSGAGWERLIYPIMHRFFSQTQAEGARAQLYAAAAPDAQGGRFYAPRWFHMRGPVMAIRGSKATHDRQVAARLWAVSADLTGVDYAALAGA